MQRGRWPFQPTNLQPVLPPLAELPIRLSSEARSPPKRLWGALWLLPVRRLQMKLMESGVLSCAQHSAAGVHHSAVDAHHSARSGRRHICTAPRMYRSAAACVPLLHLHGRLSSLSACTTLHMCVLLSRGLMPLLTAGSHRSANSIFAAANSAASRNAPLVVAPESSRVQGIAASNSAVVAPL